MIGKVEIEDAKTVRILEDSTTFWVVEDNLFRDSLRYLGTYNNLDDARARYEELTGESLPSANATKDVDETKPIDQPQRARSSGNQSDTNRPTSRSQQRGTGDEKYSIEKAEVGDRI